MRFRLCVFLLPLSIYGLQSPFCSSFIAFLQQYHDGTFSAITLLTDDPLSTSNLHEFVECIDVMGRPFNVLNFKETPIDVIEAMVQIYETFIIYSFDGNITEKFFEISEYTIFAKNPWVMISKAGAYDLERGDLEGVYERVPNLTIRTKFYHYYVDEEEHNGWIAEVYRIFPKGSLKVNQLFSIKNFSLIPTNSNYIWSRRKNLEGFHIKIGYLKSSPFFTMGNDQRPKGIFFDIYNVLKENLNLTETFIESVDGFYGSDGETGLVGMANRGEIDISIADFDITIDRIKYVEFTTSIYLDEKSFYTLNFGNTQTWGTFVGVFSDKFWAATFACSLLFVPFLWLVFRSVDGEVKVGLLESFIIPFRTIAILEIFERPVKIPGRILVVTICLFGGMIYWIYNAGLTSVLTVDTSSSPISSFDDLLKHTDYQLIIQKGTFLEHILGTASETTNPVLKKVNDLFIKNKPNSLALSLEEALETLLEGKKSVLLFPQVALSFKYPNMTCLIHKSPSTEFKANIGWIVRKDLPFLPLIDFQLSKFAQTGVLRRFWNRYKEGQTSCHSEDFRPIKNKNIFSAYIILTVGIVLSILIFILESFFQCGVQKSRSERQVLKKTLSFNPHAIRY